MYTSMCYVHHLNVLRSPPLCAKYTTSMWYVHRLHVLFSPPLCVTFTTSMCYVHHLNVLLSPTEVNIHCHIHISTSPQRRAIILVSPDCCAMATSCPRLFTIDLHLESILNQVAPARWGYYSVAMTKIVKMIFWPLFWEHAMSLNCTSIRRIRHDTGWLLSCIYHNGETRSFCKTLVCRPLGIYLNIKQTCSFRTIILW